MESIYEPERFKSSEVVNLKEYFTQYSNKIVGDIAVSSSGENECGGTEDGTNIMGININSEIMKSLEESCR